MKIKCKEEAMKLCANDPSLTLVRGYYICPIWGKHQHWWCKNKEGQIIDSTSDQFPSKGIGEYEEYDGIVECAECGLLTTEVYAIEHWIFESNYAFCSGECNMKFVGL